MTAGRRALVTGASHGLGAHLATRLVEQGWTVTGLGRRPVAELSPEPGFDYLQADLSAIETIETLQERIGAVPELVVHCAVIYPERTEQPPSITEMETAFRVNALAPYRLTLDLLARKAAEQFCCCVIINSDSMFHADPGSAVYAASKAALRVFSTALATACRSQNASVATLLLGPLADPGKVADLRRIAEKRNLDEAEVVRLFLRKSNPDLVIEELIDFESCFRCLENIVSLGTVANGMLCRLDGGSAGSLI